MDNKLEKAKEIIKDNYEDGNCGIFNTRNHSDNWLDNLYEDQGLEVDICYEYSYFEVFGLSQDEFEELEAYYNELF